MFEIIEEKVTTILRPTGINLAPWVINPYQGCQMGCLFCYAQFNKSALKAKKTWGSYVKVKINAGEVLEKELKKIKPKKVLLGSTTECFQGVEKKYNITRAIISLLNKAEVDYIILSRSPVIVDYVGLLKQGFCREVYFTVDTLPEILRKKFEPQALAQEKSIGIINRLCAHKIKTTAYFCPVMPWLFDSEGLIKDIFPRVKHLEFELLNFKLSGIEELIKYIGKAKPELSAPYRQLLKDKVFYEKTMNECRVLITEAAKKHKKEIKVHTHDFESYFGNIY